MEEQTGCTGLSTTDDGSDSQGQSGDFSEKSGDSLQFDTPDSGNKGGETGGPNRVTGSPTDVNAEDQDGLDNGEDVNPLDGGSEEHQPGFGRKGGEAGRGDTGDVDTDDEGTFDNTPEDGDSESDDTGADTGDADAI